MTGRDDTRRQTGDVTPRRFDDDEVALGDVLRGERATKGKSLLDVQRDMKLKAEYLAGIEAADLSVFETPGFVAGYVRAYARYLEMDPDWVFARFCAESGFSQPHGLNGRRKPRAQANTGRTGPRRHGDRGDAILSRSPISTSHTPGLLQRVQVGAVASLMVLVLLAGGLGYGAWSVLQEIQRVTLTPVETPLPTSQVAGVSLETEGLGVDNAAPTAADLERLYRPEALDAPVMEPRDGPIATLDPNTQGVYAGYISPDAALPEAPDVPVAPVAQRLDGAAPVTMEVASAEATPAEDSVQVTQPAPPQVVMFARRPVWVRVRAPDDSVLLEKILEQGERYTVPQTDGPATLRAGNSGSLFFAVNGETLGPAGPGTSVAKNVDLSPAALTDRYDAPDMSDDSELQRLAELVSDPAASPGPDE